MTPAVLEISQLHVTLPGHAGRPFAVQDLSLRVMPGQTVCVVGESGSGKSVMANAVMRLLPPSLQLTQGSIRFDGQELTRLRESEFRALRGAQMGMIFQEPMTALNPVMSIGDQIDEALWVHGIHNAQQRQRRVLELLGDMQLPDPGALRYRFPFQLSGGQRQRVLIAIAMALSPRLLIADEPTTALDVTTQAQILALIRRLQVQHQLAVLFITHDFGVVADIADEVVVMKNGIAVERGPADRILHQPAHAYTQALIEAVPRLRRDAQPASASSEAVLQVVGLSKRYPGHRKGFWRRGTGTLALDDVNLTIGAGETVGLVGESGSGKTSLGQAIVRLLDVDQGEIRFKGVKMERLTGAQMQRLRPRIQMIFQDPFASLNPRHRIARIISENLVLSGVDATEAHHRMLEMLSLVGLPEEAAQRYPHEFSGGQRQRIGIARALVMRPDLIVADEPVSALDVSVQKQILQLLRQVRERFGLAMLFITHDLRVASQVCDRIAVMHQGRIVEMNDTQNMVRAPQHEHTRRLFDAMPGQLWESGRKPMSA